MILAFDIDGVVCNLAEEMVFRLGLMGINASYSEITTFRIEGTYDVYDGWFAEQEKDATFFLNCKPYEDAWYMINKWFSQGHDIYFVTARNEDTMEVTERWLDMWDFQYNAVAHTEHGEKLAIVDFLEADFFVEDRMEEADAVARGGKVSYLIDRPWNQGETPAIRIPCFRTLDKQHVNP